MTSPRRSFASIYLVTSCAAALALAACTGSESVSTGQGGSAAGSTGDGGSAGGIAVGGSTGTGHGGTVGTGGTTATGGTTGAGGSGPAGVAGTTGASGRGGASGVGGSSGNGGTTGNGGARGGSTGSGGTTGTGGVAGGAGHGGTTGRAGASGTGGTAGTSGTADGGPADDPDGSVACSMTTAQTGGTQHCSSNASGMVGSYQWTIWSSGGGGCMTPHNVDATFGATWNNSGDFLARIGLQWNSTKTYDQLGTISADFAETKTGSGGGYSYIGIYGWSENPTHEYYIVEDSYQKLPLNPGGTKMGTVALDGGTYDLYTRNASGASIDGTTNFVQFFSIRQTARQCGHISISEHFKAWAAAGMTLGKMEEAKILVEAGGGSGSAEFTAASISAQ